MRCLKFQPLMLVAVRILCSCGGVRDASKPPVARFPRGSGGRRFSYGLLVMEQNKLFEKHDSCAALAYFDLEDCACDHAR